MRQVKATATRQANATATPQAKATDTRQVNATAKATAKETAMRQANATATRQANATATPQAKATVKATATPQAKATVNATATPQAKATATPPASPSSEAQIDALLAAVAEGRLSVEELVRAAAPQAGFLDAAGRLLAAANAVERQPTRVRHRVHDPAVLRKALRVLRRRLANQPDVHLGLGRHYRGGHPGDEFGLVAHVHRKGEVAPEHAIQPVTVTHRGVRYTLRCDVKQIERAAKQSTLRPGNHAVVGTDVEHGTLSGVVNHGNGAVALISGHLARGANGGKIKAREASGAVIELGTVLQLRDDATMDAAVVGAVPPGEVGVLTIGPADVLDPATIFKGVAVTVLATEGGGSKTSFVEDVRVPATFETGTMTGLIALAPRVTDKGDSGAAVLNDAGQVIGFVVGASDTRTFVISAKEVLREMLGL